MKIARIKVQNFRSFENLEVNLDAFNVIIGPNAAGKSNFVEIFNFLRDISREGLENAVSLQGGIDNIKNVNLDAKTIQIAIEFDLRAEELSNYEMNSDLSDAKNMLAIVESIEYELVIALVSRHSQKYQVQSEEIIVQFRFTQGIIGKIFLIRTEKGSLRFKTEPKNLKDLLSAVTEYQEFMKFLSLLQQIKNFKDTSNATASHLQLHPHETLIESSIWIDFLFKTPIELPPWILLPFKWLLRFFLNTVSIYYLDPKKAKKSIPVTSKADLEFDGSNLSLVLKRIIDDRNKKEQFTRLLQQLLPFIERINVKPQVDKSFITLLKENYSRQKSLPAFLISDGTILVMALLVILYFEKKQFIIIEEPERNIHPSLQSHIIEMMLDATKQLGKQIIITTHNTEILKHVPPKTVLFVKRNEYGNSIMYRPIEREEVQRFLEEEMGINDLFTMGLLEW